VSDADIITFPFFTLILAAASITIFATATGEAMFRIELTPEALDDLESQRVFDQKRLVTAMEVQLSHEPARATRNQKKLRPNELAEWELRIEAFRVFYDVLAENEIVKVVAIGVKEGNDLFIHGEKYEL
jgi:mRNA-degrading endonuclease RelE of RelBE toxin-antitoxin system